MFSALESLFSVTPRKTEQTNTRQDIQRHDPDYERPRREKNSKENDDFAQNSATVSVDALRIFLENFVKNGASENAQSSLKSLNNTLRKTEPTPDKKQNKDKNHPKSGTAAYAASTYQNTAQANEKSTILLETTDAAQGPPLDLSAADIRVIYTLIEDLKSLNAAHIEYLKIERAASFLESLLNAVNKAKTAL